MPPKINQPTLAGSAMHPLADGIIVPLLHQRLLDEHAEEGEKPTSAGTLLRGSEAFNCSRQIAFRVTGTPRDLLVPPETLMGFAIGNNWHAAIQEVLTEMFEATTEVQADWRPQYDMSGDADAVYDAKFGRVCVEIKTISGYGFDLATGAKRSADQLGPKPEHIVQAAIYACSPSIQAGYLHIIYINKDKSTIAEWMLEVDSYVEALGQSPREAVEWELQRQTGILARIDEGTWPKRYIIGFGEVTDPPDAGSRNTPWNCRYCGWQPSCKQMPTGPTPMEQP